MARKNRHNTRKEPKLFPNITAEAVAAVRERIRNDKDMGAYIKKRPRYSPSITYEIYLMAMTMFSRKDAVFSEFLDVAHMACVRTDMYRLCPNITKHIEESHVSGESFDIDSVMEECERNLEHNEDDKMYERARRNTVAAYRILRSHLTATLYMNYPRLRKILETYSNVRINAQ